MTCDLPSPELSIHSRWILAYLHRFIPRNVQSISIHNRQWITKILSMGKLKMWHIPTMEYYTAVKINELWLNKKWKIVVAKFGII